MCYIKMNVASIISSCCSKCCRLEFSQGGPFSMQPIKYLFTSIRLVWHLFTPNIQAVSGVKKSSAHTLRRSPGFVSVIRGRKTYHCLQFRTIYYRSATTSILYQHQWYLNISFTSFSIESWVEKNDRMVSWSDHSSSHQSIWLSGRTKKQKRGLLDLS